jgi:hypothetical protein
MLSCKHKLDGLCAACAQQKPYTVFKYEECKKEDCKCCGYFWGPGNEKLAGQKIKWDELHK